MVIINDIGGSMKSLPKKIMLVITITLGLIVLFFVGSITFFTLGRVHDLALQRRHLIEIRQWYNSDEFIKVEETEFVSFDINDPLLRFNEIQMLATHNSYKKMGSGLGKFFIGLGDSFDEAQSLKYSYNSITSQLNVGIRSFELDIRFRDDKFEVVHVPLVDNRSNATNLPLALEEINLWSKNHPKHIPIVILFELKNDWLILDPELKAFTPNSLEALDQTISTAFGSKLYSPKHIIGTHETLKDAVTIQGWPLLKNMLGKVIIVLHPGEFTQMYVDMDPNFTKMVMFPAAENMDIDHSYTSFIIHNDPNVDFIRSLVDQNFIVRTGIDKRLTYTEEQYTKAVASGAQILTTDFPPNHNFKSTNYIPYLETTYTVVVNKYIKERE
jgi:hypothetical protein